MKIGLDVMGGDYAPVTTVAGAILAIEELPSDAELVLIGNQALIEEECAKHSFDPSRFIIKHASEVIGMGDHPAKAFVQKPDSSISVGFRMLFSKEIDGFASAGSTGAMMVGAVQIIKPIPGIIRPCIMSNIPRPDGNFGVLVDVGLNSDCKPEVLCQYGLLGSLYAKHVFKIANPKVALLNIGAEDEKGNLLTKATFQMMSSGSNLNFIGNIEGDQIFGGQADVIVCDGFVGNVVLKEAEGLYRMIRSRKISDDYFERFNYENYGGTPVLGINANVVVGHGISNEKAIKTMILQTGNFIRAELPDRIEKLFM